MSLEKISEENHPSKARFFFSPLGTEGTQHWKIVCDVCKKTEEFVTNQYDYNGWSGSDWDFTGLPYQVSHRWDYYVFGKYSRKRIDFCRIHRNKEIEKVVKKFE